MKRPLALIVPAALAASFALGGCTIYTYDTPAKSPKKTATAKAKPTKRGPIIKGQAGGGGTDPAPAEEAPLVKGSTIFGGSTVQPFKGEAYVIPEGVARMPALDELVPFARLYTDQYNVSPQTFSGGFPGALLQDEWFAIRYVGNIVVPVAGKWTFKLVSDDGAVLYIDENRVLDNDGVHTAKTVTGDYELTAGQHALRLEYFQEKKGSVALQLFTVVGGRDVPVTGVR
jgi:hypothetical protein